MPNPKIFDALLELEASNTRTASGAGSALAVAGLVPTHWTNDSHKYSLEAVFEVTANTGGAAVVAYVEADSASNFPSATRIAQVQLATNGTGRYCLPFNLDTLKLLETGATHLRSGITVTGGTTPSVTYRAFVARANGVI